MNDRKQLAINLLCQGLSFGINMGTGFFLTSFIVKNIGSEAYGFVGLANNFVSYTQIITIALNSMAGRFVTISLHERNYVDVNKYFTSVLIANVLISVFITIPMVIVLIYLNQILHITSKLVLDVRLLFLFTFMNFLLSVLGSIFGIATFAKNRLDLSSMRDVASRLLRIIILVIVFIFLQPSVWFVGLSSLVGTVYVVTFNSYYTKKFFPEISIHINNFDFKKIKELLFSGVWNSFTQVSSILSNGLDLLLANMFINTIAMGSLSISKTIPNMILSFFATLANVFAPQLTIYYANKDINGMREQLLSSIKILGSISSIPMAILFSYGSTFYQLWLPNEDSHLLEVLSIITCFEFVIVLPLEGLWSLFTVTNKVKQSSIYLLINSMITLSLVFVGFLFTNDSNLRLYIIAGTSTIFSMIRAITFLPIYGAYCLNLKWTTFYRPMVKNLISVVIITFISILLSYHLRINSWTMFFVASILTAFIALIVNSVLVMGRRERALVKSIASKQLKRILSFS